MLVRRSWSYACRAGNSKEITESLAVEVDLKLFILQATTLKIVTSSEELIAALDQSLSFILALTIAMGLTRLFKVSQAPIASPAH
ncbi:hypothetical protein NQ317_018542 [Molorchus minor]|uniref:Uncharacterized protein n=1 Tax=Molorchus minor TaxID=1323400 RepID=A0ABQ9JXN8_9CUCU|nr:hypothetical protein NQ317_018542 [Molorchus minor]